MAAVPKAQSRRCPGQDWWPALAPPRNPQAAGKADPIRPERSGKNASDIAFARPPPE